MAMQKFTAQTMTASLRLAREALGDDAVVLANRKTPQGVQVLAMGYEDAILMKKQEEALLASAQEGSLKQDSGVLSTMQEDMSQLKSLLSDQLSGLAWHDFQKRDPIKSLLLQKCFALGLTSSFSRKLVDSLGEFRTLDMAWQALLDHCKKSLVLGENEWLEEGGRVALFGPTGVGKTSTIAKLAAQYATKHGSGKVALISTDTYRVAAQEQLRIYASIMGVELHMVNSAATLNTSLRALHQKSLVLIDTAGARSGTELFQKQLNIFKDAMPGIQHVMTLSATSQGGVIADSLKAYEGLKLTGSVVTKLDETTNLGELISHAISHKMKIHYLTNGQRIPEDCHCPDAASLIHQAEQLSQDFALDTSEERTAYAFSGGVSL